MKKKYSLFIGRWQSFHQGHKALIQKVLDEDKNVLIAIRDTEVDEKNPYSLEERAEMIRKEFPDEDKVVITWLPDIEAVCYGREVGYAIRKIELDKKTEAISGTKIRNYKPKIIWLTGNSGAGKTTLAYALKDELKERMKNVIILDGDEMRTSISLNSGFSKEDRTSHNHRVAQLAKILNNQGCNVIISVIAPFEKVRKEIEKIINPIWIYLYKPSIKWGKDKPYEVPKQVALALNTDNETVQTSVEKIIRYLVICKK